MRYILGTLRPLRVSMLKSFSESNDVVKTFTSVGFPGNACTPWTFASCKCHHVLCTLYSELLQNHDFKLICQKNNGFDSQSIFNCLL